MSIVSDDRDLRAEVEQLLFLEARLADESRYDREEREGLGDSRLA